MKRLEFDEHSAVMTLHATPPLSAEHFRSVSEHADAWVHRAGRIHGLLILAPKFPSWRDLAEFIDHMRFMREHGQQITRIAAVTDTPPVSYMSAMSAHFSSATVRQFRVDQLRRAKMWVGEGDDKTADANTASGAAVVAGAAVNVAVDDSAVAPGEDDLVGGVVVLDEDAGESSEDIDSWFT